MKMSLKLSGLVICEEACLLKERNRNHCTHRLETVLLSLGIQGQHPAEIPLISRKHALALSAISSGNEKGNPECEDNAREATSIHKTIVQFNHLRVSR